MEFINIGRGKYLVRNSNGMIVNEKERLELEKRGLAMGIVGIVLAFAPAIGPTLSGWIINSYPWRYLFYVTLPFTIIDLILAFFLLKNVTGGKKVSMDILSLIGSTIGFGGLLYGFSNTGNYAWTDARVYAPLIIGIVFLLIFIYRQLKLEEPLLNLDVFKSKVFTFFSILVSFKADIGMILSNLFISSYFLSSKSISSSSNLSLLFINRIIGVDMPASCSKI